MKHIIKYLANDGEFLYEKNGYRIVGGEKQGMGTAWILLAKSDLEIVLNQHEYGAVTMSFRRHGDDNWDLPMELFRYWFEGKLYSASLNLDEYGSYIHEKIKSMSEDYPVLDSDGHLEFLQTSLERIEELLNHENYSKTKATIDSLAKQRAELLYG